MGFTQIGPCSEQDCKKIENVKIADDVIEGKLIGLGDITNYNSTKLNSSKCMKYFNDVGIQKDCQKSMFTVTKTLSKS